ncbi:MAG TPA: lipase [Candidatus Competibacter sp.]|nr:lipase [Candidatus Competibacter sp.]
MPFLNPLRTPFALMLLLAAFAVRAGNDYPLVLVHGFTGWGRDELLGFKYWGGFDDLQEILDQAGYRTYTGVVGPLASNWDRACELYAYIKGGTVDYGQAHAAAHGHARYGRTFPGLYPDWGTVDANGQLRKVHLIGHSQGGQTVRVLVALLTQGALEERATTPAAELSPLFQGSKSWVHSVTTLAAPHDGTSIAADDTRLLPFVRKALLGLAALVGVKPDELPYDFKLDQWRLRRGPDESFNAYLARIEQSPIWRSHDISGWDLGPDGAKDLNRRFPAQPEVYYFSWATSATVPLWPSRHQAPRPTMLPQLWITALFIGAYTRDEPGHVRIDASWWENDGLVNTRSMAGPTLDSPDRIVPLGEPLQRGAWNYRGTLAGWDHMDIVGIGTVRDVRNWYLSLARSLADLPP